MVAIFKFDHMTGENRYYRETNKKPKMFSVPGSDRNPVRAFRFYASKRPEQMNSEDSPFYLAVNLTNVYTRLLSYHTFNIALLFGIFMALEIVINWSL